MYKLSIVLPVYNVEPYIRLCVESIFKQGLSDSEFEVILVNDGTPDNSFGVISDILSQHDNITVVNQNNQGVSVARNVGIMRATGKYVLYIDPDDLLVENALKRILNETFDSDVDMIVGDFTKMSDNEIERRGLTSDEGEQKDQGLVMRRMKALDYYHHDYDHHGYVWRIFYKRVFLEKNHLQFYPDIFFQDIPYIVQSLLAADSLIKVSFPFYIYRQHSDSAVYTLNKKKLIDINTVMLLLWKIRNITTLSVKEKNLVMDTMYHVFSNYKWRILLNDDVYRERREIIGDLMQKIPNLKFTHGVKQLTTTFFFRLMPCHYLAHRKRVDNLIRKLK